MIRPLLIDLFCGAGGAAMGYYRAGFDILGIDHNPQPRYPFQFIQGDVFEVWDSLPHDRAAAYHASPPCQAYSVTQRIRGNEHPDLIQATRKLLLATGSPYAIENVVGAPLDNPLILCGTMFPGLRVRRHRLFECNPIILFPPMAHNHDYGNIPKAGRGPSLRGFWSVAGKGGKTGTKVGWSSAMRIDWMNLSELSQAIPPAYTEFIGRRLMEVVNESCPD